MKHEDFTIVYAVRQDDSVDKLIKIPNKSLIGFFMELITMSLDDPIIKDMFERYEVLANYTLVDRVLNRKGDEK